MKSEKSAVVSQVSVVGARRDGHTIHAYFNTSPESPDGSSVLYFGSEDPEGHVGAVVMADRVTGEERAVAEGVETEDAHRVACQQWCDSGRTIVYHDYRDGVWAVVEVDASSGDSRILATDRQVAWGSPNLSTVPLYGCHWDAAGFRDLELISTKSGQRETVVTARETVNRYGDWIERYFGATDVSIFFPILSPDGDRVVFKLALPGNGEFRSKGASQREGLFCFDLKRRSFLYMLERWGHPAWCPDSRSVLNTPNVIIDQNGASTPIAGLPAYPGSHPSVSPSGSHFVTDYRYEEGSGEHPWSIAVARMDGSGWVRLHTFDQTGGARSWRPPHPHPVYSADGRRVYFNANDGAWTRLHVAELED